MSNYSCGSTHTRLLTPLSHACSPNLTIYPIGVGHEIISLFHYFTAFFAWLPIPFPLSIVLLRVNSSLNAWIPFPSPRFWWIPAPITGISGVASVDNLRREYLYICVHRPWKQSISKEIIDAKHYIGMFASQLSMPATPLAPILPFMIFSIASWLLNNLNLASEQIFFLQNATRECPETCKKFQNIQDIELAYTVCVGRSPPSKR